MRIFVLTLIFAITLPMAAAADNHQKIYSWEDDDGNVYYGDSIPAKYAERPKEVVNEHGVTLAEIEGKKTEEQKEAERIEMARQAAVEQQRVADQALLAT